MRLTLRLLLALTLPGAPLALAADAPGPAAAPVAVAELERAARARTSAQPRVALAEPTAEGLKGDAPADPLEGAQPPNYLRALAGQTKAAPQFARLVRAVLYGGTLPPETKMGMALRVAQQLNSPYAAAHASRWLRASPHGRELLNAARADRLGSLGNAEQLALSYADSLTRGVHDVSDADFARTRAAYNDAQLVELTMAVCFFNYFTRMSESFGLPVEPWALDAQTTTPASVAAYRRPPARVALISDEELAATQAAAAAAKEPQKPAAGLGLGLANSQRAMLRVPDIALAWRAYGQAVREHASVGRDIQLQVSFAVSTANGCRYCTLHQVLGLRRLGVSPAKLVSMKKDDSQLTPRELAAVTFARKVTRAPASVTDEDFRALKSEFGERGAAEVLLQTCAFSFMNRLTDGLRLPSEDEAVRTYRETYGADFR
ncbi:MAG TPA: carboxymuconolactone decarboxylase family protein [Pyrinomonadaceae bacterium]|jgi:AhpD family alkylhydroperoxidase